MTQICAVLFVAALGFTAPLGAQNQATSQDRAALEALRPSLSASAHATLTATVRETSARGLPTGPLLVKAREGLAKKVPDDRIVAAVRVVGEQLVRAQLVLRSGGTPSAPPTAAELIAVADGLQRGVPEEAIGRLTGETRGRASIALSVHALADLLEEGVPLGAGLDLIGTWQAQGGDPERLKEIPAAVERLVRQGVVPARAGEAVAAGLRLGLRPGSILPADIPGILRPGRPGG